MTMHHVPRTMTDGQIRQFLRDHVTVVPKPSRSLRAHLDAYEGASPKEIEQIARGAAPSMNQGCYFEPVEIVVRPGAHRNGFDEIVIADGNHRLAAAQQVGASCVAAFVRVDRGNRSARWVKSMVRVNPLEQMPGGSVSECVKRMKHRKHKPREPGAYCAAIADRIEPGWRSKNPQKSARQELELLLAILRAGYMTYRTSHWVVHGDDYYANHLLLQRIYEGTEKQIDSLGERLVGYYGPASVDLKTQGPLVVSWTDRFAREREPMEASLAATEAIQLQIRKANASLGPNPPLGIDDLLAGFANEKDEHIYLLRQVLGRRSAAGEPIAHTSRRNNSRAPRSIALRLANP